MKKLIMVFAMLFVITACNKDDSKDANPDSEKGYTYLTLNDGSKTFEANEKDYAEYNYVLCSFLGSNCRLTVDGADYDFKLRLYGEKTGGGAVGQYIYSRDTLDEYSRKYSFTDKTTTDNISPNGIVWWADSIVINVTHSQTDSVSPVANKTTAKGDYKAWVRYQSDRKVITGEFETH